MHRHRVKGARPGRFRLLVQLMTAAVLNGYAAGIVRGHIFAGKSKAVCVPVLNCWSCPGALGACPIGALQAVAGGGKHRISFYVLGFLVLCGTLLGRLLCGFFCPFGLVQDLLAKIPLKKITVPEKADRLLRYVKYAILLIFVLLLPAAVTNALGTGDPWFCKYICPAGTLEAGIPLVLRTPALRRAAGVLFSWKCAVLLAILLGAVKIPRVFCRYLCPLGAFYGLFNRFSLYQMKAAQEKCIGCGQCEAVCPMALRIPAELSSSECIRCGKCSAVCPAGVFGRKNNTDTEEMHHDILSDSGQAESE